MRISHRKLFVYVAIPKTGSTTVRTLLDKHSDIASKNSGGPFGHHRTAAQLKETFSKRGWNWEKYFKFTVVRHPLQRLLSAHNYRVRIGSSPPSPYLKKHGSVFYEQCCDHAKSFHNLDAFIQSGKCAIKPLTHFTLSHNWKPALDHWVKLEDLHSGLHIAWEKLNLDVADLDEIQILNQSGGATGTNLLSRSSENWLRERFKTDFEAFGYQ